MNKIYVLFVGLCFVVILPVLDMTMNLSEKWQDDTKFQISISVSILLATLLAAYLSVLLEKINKREERSAWRHQSVQSKLADLSKAIRGGNASLCFPVNRKELYTKLDELVSGATQKLELMYFGEKPPKQLEKFEARDQYVVSLDRVIGEQRCHVKRIILLNDANKLWIKSIANKFKNKRFFSLYLIERTLVPSLSIQVIDDDKVIVISTSKTASVDKKHIYMDSKELNLIYHAFYKSVLENTIPIIENGVLNDTHFLKYLK